MGSTPGVFRATYQDKDGARREASTWVATFWDPARRRTVKEYGFPTAGAAKQRRAEMMTAAGKDRLLAHAAGELQLHQMLDFVLADYELRNLRSLKDQRERATRLKDEFGAHTPVRLVDEHRIAAFARRLKDDGLSVPTINRYLALLKRGFKLAQRRVRGIQAPYIPISDESVYARQGFFEREQIERMLSHMTPWTQHVVRALYITGWRRGEIFNAQWSDVVDGFLVIGPGKAKNNRPRKFPLTFELVELLEIRRAETARIEGMIGRPCPWIFSFDGNRIYDIKQQWNKARKLAGIPRERLLHDLRRTAVRDLIRSGVDRDTAKRITGHLTDSVFTRYNITDGADLTRAAQSLFEYRYPESKDLRKTA